MRSGEEREEGGIRKGITLPSPFYLTACCRVWGPDILLSASTHVIDCTDWIYFCSLKYIHSSWYPQALLVPGWACLTYLHHIYFPKLPVSHVELPTLPGGDLVLVELVFSFFKPQKKGALLEGGPSTMGFTTISFLGHVFVSPHILFFIQTIAI